MIFLMLAPRLLLSIRDEESEAGLRLDELARQFLTMVRNFLPLDQTGL
jgi:hypothetical protein